MQRGVTNGLGAFEEDLFGGDHGEAAAHVFVDGVAELGPGAALDGAFAETRVGELARARGGCDFDLVAVLVELVLNDLLYAVFVGPYDLPRRQEEVEILAVVLLQLAPPQLRRFPLMCHRCNSKLFLLLSLLLDYLLRRFCDPFHTHCNSATATPRQHDNLGL